MAQNDNTVTIDDESPPPSMLSVMEEDEYYPQTLQEEMNEILEAFYNIVGEDGIRQHQRHVETIFERKIADSALQRPSMAPTFELTDQDGELVVLQELLTRGPVVLVFYRGKWCPHCNATLMRLSRAVKQFQARGASVVAISPMLPDGTQYLATKQNLQFPVLSDVANTVARQYRLTFEVTPEFRQAFLKVGKDIPLHNGDASWVIPLPATYVIGQDGTILWSFVDDDPGVRADVDEILAALPSPETNKDASGDANRDVPSTRTRKRRGLVSTFGKRPSLKRLFGKKKQTASEFLKQYQV